ncbi:hypothetical protein BJ508DRAFT_92701 [Ascobolus immersus RN42]|uniref:C2H2-type domain-containing protein n=1 Tax=Ascobolus immersus RN42 TaxID=1160509 RepID=A0A3N4I7V8_ASCIM|nr:hypothetical protein BJ508DRAFT_92701 [Ascobolus immersus RN42]
MGPIRRSKHKRRARDMDQIHEELRSNRKMEQFQALVPNDEKPGLGQFQCLECAVFHESEYALKHHQRGKKHKKRVKYLKEVPYTHAEADAAAGRGVLKYSEMKEKAIVEELAADFLKEAAPVEAIPDLVGPAEMETDAPVEDAPAVNEDEIL